MFKTLEAIAINFIIKSVHLLKTNVFQIVIAVIVCHYLEEFYKQDLYLFLVKDYKEYGFPSIRAIYISIECLFDIVLILVYEIMKIQRK